MSFGPDKIRYRIGSRSGEIRWRLITRWMGMRWFLYRDSTKSKVKHVLGSYLDEETAKVAARDQAKLCEAEGLHVLVVDG